MTGVPHSSSQARSSVTQQAAAPRAFDVGSEAELLQLLNYLRRGPFLPDQKNMLRDVVLDFAVCKDPAVLGAVSSALSRNNASLTLNGASLMGSQPVASAPAAVETQAQPAEVAAPTPTPNPVPAEPVQEPGGFGGGRPQPAFGQPAATPASSAAPVSKPVPDTPQVKSIPVASADPNPAPSVAESVAPSTQAPAIKEKPAAEVIDESVTPPEPAAPATPQTPEPEPAAPASTPVTATDPLTRIKEIKTLVNNKVGNPVNLIDSDNQTGREYMNALLNAMKTVNGGTHEEAALAMQRLEKAYAAVETSLNSGEIELSPEESAPVVSEPVTAPEPAAPVTPPTPEPTSVTPVAPPAPVSEPASDPQENTAHGFSDAPQPEHVSPVAPQAVPAPPTPEPVPVAQTSEPVVPPVPPTPAVPEAPTTQPPTQTEPSTAPQDETPVPPQSLAAKVAAERANRAEVTQKNAAEIQAEKAALMHDPLQAEDVSKGLEQLLSEWKLFKSSGIFGTGPNGYDHPLFKAIAPLPMAAVIAGRFEGVTPEVRQSISDYMSGWRYEQGVVHEMNEPFEHYLRRVVHQILQKHPKQTGNS